MTTDERRRLGKRVAGARIEKGWSKEEAARKAGMSSITWKRVEDGLNVHDTSLATVLRTVGLATTESHDDEVQRLRQTIADSTALSERDKSLLLAQLDAMTNEPPSAERGAS